MKVSSVIVLLFFSTLAFSKHETLTFTDHTEVKPVKVKLMEPTTFEKDLLGRAQELTSR
jgi:hypothetical protein